MGYSNTAPCLGAVLIRNHYLNMGIYQRQYGPIGALFGRRMDICSKRSRGDLYPCVQSDNGTLYRLAVLMLY